MPKGKDKEKPLLGQDAEEARRLMYGGRRTDLLKDPKRFDRERLEDSPLFKDSKPKLFNPRKLNLDQATQWKLAQIRELIRESETRLTGKAKRQYIPGEGYVYTGGRFGGVKKSIPELRKVKAAPARILAALDRGKGKVYRAVADSVSKALDATGEFPKARRRSAGRPVVPAHPKLTSKCKSCGVAHAKGPHRFHGEGAYHATHLFSFNPPMVKIYDRVGMITAQKGPGHKCSPGCRRSNHWYKHTFKTKQPILGAPDGRLVIGAGPRPNPPKISSGELVAKYSRHRCRCGAVYHKMKDPRTGKTVGICPRCAQRAGKTVKRAI